MGSPELLKALSEEADEKIRTIWLEAEEEAAGLRAEALAGFEALKVDSPEVKKATEEAARTVREAAIKAGAIRLAAEAELGQRLYLLAASLLPVLRQDMDADIFSRLAQELPRLAWGSVRVSPDELERAKLMFEGLEVIADEHISGGLEAETPDRAIRVLNTFEKRLERLWTELLPALMTDVQKEVMGDGTSQEA